MFEIILLLGVGAMAGSINAIAGGGAILILPVLITRGVEPITATASISLAVLPGIIASLIGYKRDLEHAPKFFLWLIAPSMVGAYFGAHLLGRIEPGLFEAITPWLVLSAVLLMALQARIHHLIVNNKSLVKTNQQLGLPVLFLSVAFLSVYGGFFGVGVGLMFIALLGLSSKVKNAYQLSALKNWYVFGIAAVASLYFIRNDLLDIRISLLLALGTTLGGYVGARYSRSVRQQSIHQLTVIIGVVITALLFLRPSLFGQ